MRNVSYLKLKLLEKTDALSSRFKGAEEIYEKLKKINTSGFLSPEDKEFIEELSKISFEIGEEEFSLLDEEEKEALLIPRGNLLPNEWEEIKKHPVESDRILEQIPFPESMLNLRTIVRQHHEKLDGSGYPDGKEAEEILFQSRILTICDVYDALTAADRPYKKAFSMEKAIEILRKKGAAKAAKKAERATAEGIVVSYIHAGGKVGALVEIDCETDFVARTEDFKTLGYEIAMQVAAMAPEYVSREEVPAEVVEKEKEILKQQALSEGKPEHIVEKIVEGRLNKFYSEKCLLDQPWIKDDSKTIGDLVREYITKLGENIKVRRFCRFEVGK